MSARRNAGPTQLLESVLRANVGMVRVGHLLDMGRRHGISEDELRQAAIKLNLVGLTKDGVRYVGSDLARLTHWVEYVSSVREYQRKEQDRKQPVEPVPFDDELEIQ